MLVRDDKIVGAGTGEETPASDLVVDLEEATLLPGFCDAHVHLSTTGLYASGLDVRGETVKERILTRLRTHTSSDDAVLFGGNFEDPHGSSITRDDLDGVVGHRPALLARADMHSCVVSTALLEMIKVDEGMDRDASGRPTGYLREQAAGAAWRAFDASLTPDQQRRLLRVAARLALSKGITAVHEMFVLEWRNWGSLEILLDEIAALPLHVTPYVATDEVERVAGLGLPQIGGDYFLDGSFGSHTAWMSEPFVSEVPAGSSPHGVRYRDDEELIGFFSAAQRAGLQVGVHAIGDAAIDQALTSWEKVAADVGWDEVRRLGHRIEHFECAHDDHIERAHSLGLRISIQPAFDRFWGGSDGLYAHRIGSARAALMNRFGTMRKAGLLVGAGSDSTVTPLDPFLQMASLRAHTSEKERFLPEEALQAHTCNAHKLAPGGDDAGTIEVGGQADFVLVDRDPVEVDVDALLKAEVIETWLSGKRVWPDSQMPE